MIDHVDVVVVGGGIVGLATARAVATARRGARVLVVEKEATVAAHQTGRNSGVVHSGLYYRPGSAKARLVAEGRELLAAFCREHGIPLDVCGKVVVATDVPELGRLSQLASLADAHGLVTDRLDDVGLRRLEPHAAGLAALHVPSTGIVDYVEVCRALVAELTTLEVELRLATRVLEVREVGGAIRIETDGGALVSQRLVNCAGLHSDRVARLGGVATDVRIVPFRGEYHELRPQARHLVRNLIYPVPDPAFPFLGVHLTRSIHGGVHAGPNAVLALAREGYSWRAVSRADLAELARDPGLRRLARRYWRTGMGEVVRSLSDHAFVHALRRLVPDVSVADLEPAPAGVRAQALRPDGALVDDFEFAEAGSQLHVLNAPSPAATASLAIAEHIARRLPT